MWRDRISLAEAPEIAIHLPRLTLRGFLETLNTAVSEGVAAGQSVEELQASIRLNDYSHVNGYDTTMPRIIQEAHRQITRGF